MNKVDISDISSLTCYIFKIHLNSNYFTFQSIIKLYILSFNNTIYFLLLKLDSILLTQMLLSHRIFIIILKTRSILNYNKSNISIICSQLDSIICSDIINDGQPIDLMLNSFLNITNKIISLNTPTTNTKSYRFPKHIK